MIKGGYKIVNFNGTELSGTSVTLPGVYDQIVDNYDKPILVSGVIIDGELQDDAYADVKGLIAADFSKYLKLTVYGGVITVTEDDEITFTSAMSNTELTEDVNNINQELTTMFDQTINTVNDLGSKSVLNRSISVGFSPTFMRDNFGTTEVKYIGFLTKSTDALIDMFAYRTVNGSICMGRYSLETNQWTYRFKTSIEPYTPA